MAQCCIADARQFHHPPLENVQQHTASSVSVGICCTPVYCRKVFRLRLFRALLATHRSPRIQRSRSGLRLIGRIVRIRPQEVRRNVARSVRALCAVRCEARRTAFLSNPNFREQPRIFPYFFPSRCSLVREGTLPPDFPLSLEVAINHGGLASIADGQAKEFFLFSC